MSSERMPRLYRWRSFERLLRLCTRFREAVSRVLCFAKKEFAEMSVSTTHATLPVLQWHESETSVLPLSEKSLQSISMDRWNAYRSQSRIMESQFCGFQWSLVGRHLHSYSIPNDPRLQQDWISSWSMGAWNTEQKIVKICCVLCTWCANWDTSKRYKGKRSRIKNHLLQFWSWQDAYLW